MNVLFMYGCHSYDCDVHAYGCHSSEYAVHQWLSLCECAAHVNVVFM